MCKSLVRLFAPVVPKISALLYFVMTRLGGKQGSSNLKMVMGLPEGKEGWPGTLPPYH